MFSCFKSVVGNSTEHVAKVHNKGAFNWSHRFILTITSVDLETMVVEGREKSEEARVCVDGSGEAKLVCCQLGLILRLLCTSWEIVDYSKS